MKGGGGSSVVVVLFIFFSLEKNHDLESGFPFSFTVVSKMEVGWGGGGGGGRRYNPLVLVLLLLLLLFRPYVTLCGWQSLKIQLLTN